MYGIPRWVLRAGMMITMIMMMLVLVMMMMMIMMSMVLMMMMSWTAGEQLRPHPPQHVHRHLVLWMPALCPTQPPCPVQGKPGPQHLQKLCSCSVLQAEHTTTLASAGLCAQAGRRDAMYSKHARGQTPVHRHPQHCQLTLLLARDNCHTLYGCCLVDGLILCLRPSLARAK